MKRSMTEKEEKVYRCRHHDFGGLTTRQTVSFLRIREITVQRIIRKLKRDFPHLFPILTQQQLLIRDCICEKGMTHEKIAAALGISLNTLKARIARLKKKGVYFEKPKKTLQYRAYLDDQIRYKF